jgi:DNA-binding GntR family transcriptional regulator
VSKDELSVNNEEHQKLAEAVLARDAPGTRRLMTYHINGALEEVIAMLRKNEMI